MLYITHHNSKKLLLEKKGDVNVTYHYYPECKLLNADYEEDDLHLPNSGVLPILDKFLDFLIEYGFKECFECKFQKIKKLEQELPKRQKLNYDFFINYIKNNPNHLNQRDLEKEMYIFFKEKELSLLHKRNIKIELFLKFYRY